MAEGKILYVVHCVDTEGPLDESLKASFDRLKSIFDIEIEPTEENLKKIQKSTYDCLNEYFLLKIQCFQTHPDLLHSLSLREVLRDKLLLCWL